MNINEILKQWEELKPLLDEDIIELIEKFLVENKDNEQIIIYFNNRIKPLYVEALDEGGQVDLGVDIQDKKKELEKLFALNPIDYNKVKNEILSQGFKLYEVNETFEEEMIPKQIITSQHLLLVDH